MDDFNKIEKMISSYLLGELSDSERKEIEQQIDSEPAVREILDQLSKTMKLVLYKNVTEKVKIEDEWKQFEETRLKREHPAIFGGVAERFGNEVIQDLNSRHTNRRFRRIATFAVAASLTLAVAWGLSIIFGGQSSDDISSLADHQVEQPTDETKTINNNSNSNINYVLPDKSSIVVAPGSSISFNKQFNVSERNVTLRGKALFTVAKDKTRPFTVYSDGVTTTALGTSFTVDAFRTSTRISIRLHEGSIVIKGVDQYAIKIDKSYYLKPGEEFVFDRQKVSIRSAIAKAGSFTNKNSTQRNKINDADNLEIPTFKNGSFYTFNNQDLGQVLDQLKDMYETEIIYNKAEIQKINFAGTFKTTDSLETILKLIGRATNLVVTREGAGFRISL